MIILLNSFVPLITCIGVIGTLLYNSKIIKQNKELNAIYVRGIRETEQNVVNHLECLALNTQFDLLDYDKITNLIYAPFHHQIISTYIRLMNKIIENKEKGMIIYSNIVTLYDKIIQKKEKDDNKLLNGKKLENSNYKCVANENKDNL